MSEDDMRVAAEKLVMVCEGVSDDMIANASGPEAAFVRTMRVIAAHYLESQRREALAKSVSDAWSS